MKIRPVLSGRMKLDGKHMCDGRLVHAGETRRIKNEISEAG